MKRFILVVLSLLALSADRTPQEKYIEQYSSIAVSEMERTGVPASITIAQGLVESRYGMSPLAVKGNNHFGIKCHNDWTGSKMYHDDDLSGECFRVYPTAEQSFRDHSDFLRYRDRYKSLFELESTDYKAWAHGLKKAGYATDPAYASKLIKVIEDYQLYRFDCKVAAVPEAPLEIEAPRKLDRRELAGRPEYREELKFSLSHNVMTINGVAFVKSAKGETYKSIAKEFGLFPKEILNFNDLECEEDLEEGTVVFVARKKKMAERGLDKYIVDHDGENLRDIAQRFGVRLSSIRKMNGLKEGDALREGDTILLR